MANWAVVIGINQYWLPRACLAGAVKDALAIGALEAALEVNGQE